MKIDLVEELMSLGVCRDKSPSPWPQGKERGSVEGAGRRMKGSSVGGQDGSRELRPQSL